VRVPTWLRPGKRIRFLPDDLAEVTTARTEREVDPRSVQLAADAPSSIWRAVERLYATGLYPAIALCLRRHGEVVLDRAIGHARGNAPFDPAGTRLVPATPETPYCLFSASKAVTAMVVHMLDDRGALHIGDRVVEYIPEFAPHGKDKVTIRHLLAHRAGIPFVKTASEDLSMLSDRDEICRRFCEASLDSEPGRRLSYHALTGGFVLAEIVQRVTGRDLRTVLREEITEPLGLDLFGYGIAPERVDDVAVGAFTGPRPPLPVRIVADRALGMSFQVAAELANERQFLEASVPSANIVSTPDATCRFFELLRCGGELDGVRIFEARTVHRATSETSYLEVDFTLGLPVRYGVGFMLGARWVSPFGPDSAEAFGHVGLMNIHCWADPARAISVALITTGKPLLAEHLLTLWNLLGGINRHCPRTAAR
jgi:CubicO group peptidase (beta-lactamase class C family)